MSERYLLLGTAKGLIIYKKRNGSWVYESDYFLGVSISMALQDPHDGYWWVCLDHRHWGPKLQYSKDQGATWIEIDAPKYPDNAQIKDGVRATLLYIWNLTFGLDPGTILVGTEPGGLFISLDYGKHFSLVKALWEHPSRQDHWFGGGRNYAGIHSIVIDPVDKNHYYVGISCAGVFETCDNGNSWQTRNKGLRADYLPNPYIEVGQDPHCLLACNTAPSIMWQQNHCGVFRTTDAGAQWSDVTDSGEKARYGFCLGIDHKDPLKAWVVPATSDSKRIAMDKSLFIMHTKDGGKSWKKQRNGLPQQNCFDIVLRHAMDVRDEEIAFGTSGGSIYVSDNGGDSWQSLNDHLPRIFSVRFT